MKEVIAYFESLETRLANLESKVAELEGELENQKARNLEILEKLSAAPVDTSGTVPEPQAAVQEVQTVQAVQEVQTPQTPEAPQTPQTPQTPETPQTPPTPPTPLGAVTDLSKAISLGDRFLFTRELFAGRGEELQKVVSSLNGQKSLDEAVAWCDQHYQWNKDSKAYELFLAALKRRFA